MATIPNSVYGRSSRVLRWWKDIHTKSTGKRIQVAAICYRLRDGDPEFLLVRTRSGRWTFPKGGVDGDATYAEAAAREAYEEAGVEGRTHLCEVDRLVPPIEDHRDPTWFKADKARRRLRENRSPELAGEVVQVIDRALDRIRERASRFA